VQKCRIREKNKWSDALPVFKDMLFYSKKDNIISCLPLNLFDDLLKVSVNGATGAVI
jgi:hypothetical protein